MTQRPDTRRLGVIAAALAVVAFGCVTFSASAQDDMGPPPDEQPRFDDRRGGDRPRMRDGDSFSDERRPRRGERGERGDMRERFGEDGPQLSDEEIAEAMEVLKEYDAKVAAHAESLRETNPTRYRMLVRRYMPQIRRLMYLKKSEPEAYELHLDDMRLGAESERLAREYREADRDNDLGRVADLRRELKDVVTRHFDVRQRIKERQLARLEEMVKRLRDQIDERREQRPVLIDGRMDELTSDRRERMW